MSNKFSRTPAPFVLEPKPSRWLRYLQLLAIVLAVVAVFQTRLELLQQILLLIGIAAYAAASLRQSFPVRLHFDTDWHWCSRRGEDVLMLLEHAVVWPILIVMRFRDPQRSRFSPMAMRTLVLLPDSLPADDWRRLRVFLQMSSRNQPPQ